MIDDYALHVRVVSKKIFDQMTRSLDLDERESLSSEHINHDAPFHFYFDVEINIC